jgi:hypothetical protein
MTIPVMPSGYSVIFQHGSSERIADVQTDHPPQILQGLMPTSL